MPNLRLFINLCQNQSYAYITISRKKGIIFGALDEKSIAWKVAERAVEEGAHIVLTNAGSPQNGCHQRIGRKM